MPENSENDPFCDEKLALNFKRTDDMIKTRQNLENMFFLEKNIVFQNFLYIVQE